MTYEEVLEKSREAFELHIARRRWNKLVRLNISHQSFEDSVSTLRGGMIWDPWQKFYCPSVNSEWLKNLDNDWCIWKAAFEAGWENRGNARGEPWA